MIYVSPQMAGGLVLLFIGWHLLNSMVLQVGPDSLRFGTVSNAWTSASSRLLSLSLPNDTEPTPQRNEAKRSRKLELLSNTDEVPPILYDREPIHKSTY
jgi:hypothetical protein